MAESIKAGETESGTTQPHELFHFAPLHQVLICISCRYAVQPDAIPRHLKDIHHILRGERRPFMAYASKLELKRPEEVTPPRPENFPVPYLVVEQGWKCDAPGCGHLCVSTKRMQAHWSMEHGRKGIQSDDFSSTPLQTFFRGNLLRYFTNSEQETLSHPPASRFSALNVPPNRKTLCRSLIQQRLQDKHKLHPSDNIILQHYFRSTYKSFVTNNRTEHIWLEVVPSLAYTNTFLLHGILACTSLHMAYIEPTRRETYTLQAYAHQDHALPLFRRAIDNPNEGNCDAIIAFAYLLVVYALATDADNSHQSLLLINDVPTRTGKENLVIPHWLHFIRAGCSMLCDVWERIESGPVSELAAVWETQFQLEQGRLPYLEHLLSIIPGDSSWTDEIVTVYRNAAISLARSFAHINRLSLESEVNTWSILSVWPVCVGTDYIDLLNERHPGALVLLAYYCIILKQVQECWYFEGGATRLLLSIAELLDQRWRPCIKEALATVIGEPVENSG